MDLTNQFLIAMPSLADPNFQRTVTYLCAHNNEGAMGIVINRPTELTLGEMLAHMDIEVDTKLNVDVAVMEGGPVQQERGFVLHQPAGEWDSTLRIGDDIAVATSKDILSALANGTGPQRVLIALGYAGWGAGQLEQEVLDNAWLSGPADASVIFDVPFDKRWEVATRALGVDPERLMGGAGHA